MLPTRLVFGALLLSSVVALAQEHSPLVSPKFEFKAPAGNSAEPWRIIPRQWQSSNSEKETLGEPLVLTLDGNGHARPRTTVLTGPTDDVCYTMRTYVVARDSKDSDSTHPVKATTCLPGSRLRLKTTEANSTLNSR